MNNVQKNIRSLSAWLLCWLCLQACMNNVKPHNAVQDRANLNNQLLKAAAKGELDNVKQLLDHGADPNTRDRWKRTPLHWAAKINNTDSAAIVTTLLENSANPLLTDQQGKNFLHYAYSTGNTSLADQILQKEQKQQLLGMQDNKGKTPDQYCPAKNKKSKWTKFFPF